MSHDPAYVAQTVHSWTELPGVTLSKELTEKLDKLAALNCAELYVTIPDVTNLTADNADELVTAYAQELATKEQFGKAKTQIRTVLVSSVLDGARAEIPKVIEKLTPAFDKAVETYVSAVNELPDDLSSDVLVAAGPETVKSYQTATGAAALLAQIDSWVASLQRLTGGDVPDKSVRILAPENHRELDKLDSVRLNRRDTTPNVIVPVFLAAAREGIKFEVHTPSEAQTLRAKIEAQPVSDAPKIYGQW